MMLFLLIFPFATQNEGNVLCFHQQNCSGKGYAFKAHKESKKLSPSRSNVSSALYDPHKKVLCFTLKFPVFIFYFFHNFLARPKQLLPFL
jgi:hypothetical protein